MNRQLLINLLKTHPTFEFSGTFDTTVVCHCGYVFSGDDPVGLWARHVASAIYPETAGSDKTVSL